MWWCLIALLGATIAASPYDLEPPLPLDAALNYDFGGSTTLSRHEVRLTMDAPGEQGHIVSNHDGLLPTSFEVEVELKIEGSGRNLYGDGMALWFLEEMTQPGRLMGLSELYKGASLVLDTYRNGKGGRAFPRLLVMQNDGTQPYDMANDGRANEIDGCSMRGLHNNKRQDFATLRIAYSQPQQQFVVHINYRNKWEPCISAHMDIGPVSKLALSAATGELTDSHVVRSIKLVDYTGSVPPLVVSNNKRGAAQAKIDREEGEERKSKMSFILHAMLWVFKLVFKLLLLVAVGFAALFLWRLFKKYQQKREDDVYKLL